MLVLLAWLVIIGIAVLCGLSFAYSGKDNRLAYTIAQVTDIDPDTRLSCDAVRSLTTILIMVIVLIAILAVATQFGDGLLTAMFERSWGGIGEDVGRIGCVEAVLRMGCFVAILLIIGGIVYAAFPIGTGDLRGCAFELRHLDETTIFEDRFKYLIKRLSIISLGKLEVLLQDLFVISDRITHNLQVDPHLDISKQNLQKSSTAMKPSFFEWIQNYENLSRPLQITVAGLPLRDIELKLDEISSNLTKIAERLSINTTEGPTSEFVTALRKEASQELLAREIQFAVLFTRLKDVLEEERLARNLTLDGLVERLVQISANERLARDREFDKFLADQRINAENDQITQQIKLQSLCYGLPHIELSPGTAPPRRNSRPNPQPAHSSGIANRPSLSNFRQLKTPNRCYEITVP
jgi:hypothetical protein